MEAFEGHLGTLGDVGRDDTPITLGKDCLLWLFRKGGRWAYRIRYRCITHDQGGFLTDTDAADAANALYARTRAC